MTSPLDTAVEEWTLSVHERLMRGDPAASSELAENVLPILVRKLRPRFFAVTESESIYDSVVDALLSYSKKPTQFDPGKRSLVGYLLMSAEGDLRNRMAKDRRRQMREISLPDVELSNAVGNREEEYLTPETNSTDKQALDPHLLKRITEEITDAADREALYLLAAGERSTAKFAAVWGVAALPELEQRRVVKRNKDRLKKQLQRLKHETDGK